MPGHRAAAVALELATDAGAENDGAGERDEAADRVNDGGPGEVVERHRSDGGEPTVRTPRPVTDDRVDEAADAEAVKEIADEAGAADHGAGGDGAARIREGVLEEPVSKERDARTLVGVRSPLQEEPVVTDEAIAMAEHEGEAPCIEEEPAEARVDDAFENHVDRLTRTGEARLEKHEAGLHEEHEERRDDGPHRVDRVDVRRSRRLPPRHQRGRA